MDSRENPKREIGATRTLQNFSGAVEHVKFHHSQTLYTVLRVRAKAPLDSSVTVIAHMPMPRTGDLFRFTGTWETHPVYGEQFHALSYEAAPPVTVEGIRAYLASEVEEIGPGLAGRVVEAFGLDTLRVIEEAPERLESVPGIGPKRARAITSAWGSRRATHDVLVFLYSQGLSPALAARVVNHYGDRAAEVVRTDPYRLALDIPGVGFLTADRIAMNTGIPRDAPERLKAGVLYTLEAAAARGHAFLPRRALCHEAARLLNVDAHAAEATCDSLGEALLVAMEPDPGGSRGKDAVYLPGILNAEREAARLLACIAHAPKRPLGIDPSTAVAWMEASRGVSLSERQRQAVRMAATRTCLVLTGGPGTGKTSTITAIIHLFDRAGARIALCAPTGRAARRMSEATRFEASTIHRLLEYNPGSSTFLKNENRPIEADLVVVDECSMVDITLMHHLLKAVRPGTTLVLVGDVDQLPSVGPGDCLRDVISSVVAEVVRLDTIYRQEKTSGIVDNCHRINKGAMPVVSTDLSGDFTFVPEEDPERILGLVVEHVTSRLPSMHGLDPLSDIQVLSPMHKGVLGVDNLNAVLQRAVNPSGRPFKKRHGEFRLGDKVMQTRNNYELEVFNGDIGRLVDMDERDGSCTVDFEDRLVAYSQADALDLVVAYATTIHKAQGSEYPCVVMPVHTQHALMLARNLIYTAVSRARKIVVTIGSERALRYGIENTRSSRRYTLLARRLAQEASSPATP